MECVREDSVVYVEIHVFVGTECCTIYRVPPGEYLIGRDSSCHLAVDAENVSRMHARLTFHGHRILIEDLESANGTLIGGVRICLPTPIQNGTEIHVGAARLLVQFSDETLSRITEALFDPTLGLEPIRKELTQDQYAVAGTIAEGGMGLVVKARDQRVGRLVAMKVLRGGYEYDADKMLRFVGEAQLTGQLEHPNIVPVYQVGISASGQTFYTMKYVRGQTLEALLAGLARGDQEMVARYPLSVLLTIFQKVADAVAFAHSRGVVHRDLKPANLMIGAFGEVLVMDWGLARRIHEDSAVGKASQKPDEDLAHLHKPRGFFTLEGAVVGTPPFISPEQARGENRSDPRSDIHVLGAILYAILTLRPPLFLEDLEQTIRKISNNEFIPIRKMVRTPGVDGSEAPLLLHCPGRRVPEGLAAVVEKAMRANADDRYQTVEALQAEISAWQNGFAPEAERAGFFRQLLLLLERRKRESTIFAVFAVILLGSLVFFLERQAEDKRALAEERGALAEKNAELQAANQNLESIMSKLRTTASRNYQDAVYLLDHDFPNAAREQVNLALVAAEEDSTLKASYLVIRGHTHTAQGHFSEALEDYQHAAKIIPDIVPMARIETDLAPAASEDARPKGGWDWEKIRPDTPKLERLRRDRKPR
ncbi:MAG: hypothetical protein RLZZ399_360 [Verrucomicrobiota bacterium]